MGADVPAESLEFTPVDRIFVRMGARDHIMAHQSTFLMELSETASMLVRISWKALEEIAFKSVLRLLYGVLECIPSIHTLCFIFMTLNVIVINVVFCDAKFFSGVG